MDSRAAVQERLSSSSSRKSAWENLDFDNQAYENDNEPAAMEGEQYVDGHFVTVDGTKDPQSSDPKSALSPQGCWWKFKRVIRSCWATRYTEDTKQDRELYIKTTVRELVTYMIFLTILIIIAFLMIQPVMFYYTRVLKILFLEENFPDSDRTFQTISKISDVWRFLYGPFLNGLYWDRWYNGEVIPKENELIYYENKLLGIPRMRQLKVLNGSCKIPKDFSTEIKNCYAYFSQKYEDKMNFGLNTSTAWIHTAPENMNTSGFFSIFGDYHEGGFYQDLSRNKNETLNIFNELFNNLWIGLGTRVVFIDFTLYNPNINLFSVIRLIFEFPATGGVSTKSDIRVVKLLRYVNSQDYFVGFCELLFLGFIAYYVIEEALEIKKHRWQYFTEFWNWLDIAVIVISIVCAGFNLYRTVSVGKLMERLLRNMQEFPPFDFLSYCQQQFNNAIAVTLFFAWIKIFKYISFNKTMTQLSSTLSRCSKDLAGFAIMFFIIFFAFAQLGYFIFGAQLRDFNTLYDAGITQFRIVLGDFDYQQLESVHRILGPLYFILFVFFVFFVLINMFLAIINDTYSEVKSELATQKNEFEMADYFKNTAKSMMDRFHVKQQKIKDIQQVMQTADINHDMKLDFDEWRNDLKSRGYAEGEIEAVFAKYDADGDRALNTDEQINMERDLRQEKDNIDHRIMEQETKDTQEGRPGTGVASAINYDEYSLLRRRVEKMEENIFTIVTKLDGLLESFSQIDRMKGDQSRVVFNLLEALSVNEEVSEGERRDRINQLIELELQKYDMGNTGREDLMSHNSLDLRSRPTTAKSNQSLIPRY